MMHACMCVHRGLLLVSMVSQVFTHLFHVSINEGPSAHNFMRVNETPDLIHDSHLLEKRVSKCMCVPSSRTKVHHITMTE